MIIKTLRWKTGAYGRLVDYVGKELLAYVGKEEDRSSMILHNLRPSDDLDHIAQQFAENDTYRKRRKNGVAMYHEILSFHTRDREAITPDMLEDITREYLRIRAPHALAFACPHYDRDHVHVHIAISGTEFRRSKTLRMDNRTFAKVRKQIEEYQLSRYPELEHSIVHLPKADRSKAVSKDIEGEQSAIERSYDEAESVEDFIGRVADVGVETSTQPLDGAPGRFTFDMDAERLKDLELRVRELHALKRLQVVAQALNIPAEPVVDDLIERYDRHIGIRPPTGDDVAERMEELETARAQGQDRGDDVGLEL